MIDAERSSPHPSQPALTTGAVAERMKFSSLLIFTAAWSFFVRAFASPACFRPLSCRCSSRYARATSQPFLLWRFHVAPSR